MESRGRLIKEKLLPVREIDRQAYDYLLEKVEFNPLVRFKKESRQVARRYLAGGIKEYCKRISISDVIARVNSPSPKKKILYVSALPTFNLVRQSIYLRQTGKFETIILTESPWLGDFVEKYFDSVYVYDSCYSLTKILNEVVPYLIHVLGCSFYSEYHAVLARLLSKCPMVFEFYDIASLCISKGDADAEAIWGKNNIELMFFSEKFACEQSDGLILGYSQDAIEKLKECYDIKVPVLEFHSYICDEFIGSENGKYSNQDGGVHLVLGGNVSPSSANRKFFGDSQYQGLIDTVTKQEIYYDVYYSPHFSPTKAKRLYSDYIQMARKNPFFNFEKGILPDKVTTRFAKYDFGTMVSLFNTGTFHAIHNSTRLPGRFSMYLEAGLPMIVSEEMEYLSEIIKDYGIGIVVGFDDLENLTEIIKSYDRKKLNANVKRAREELSMKRHIVRLINFYEQVVHGKNKCAVNSFRS